MSIRELDKMRFGEKIRQLRESKVLVLRKPAMLLDIDTATLYKIEKGYRQARLKHIQILANSLETDEIGLKTHWIADKIVQILEEEDVNLLNY